MTLTIIAAAFEARGIPAMIDIHDGGSVTGAGLCIYWDSQDPEDEGWAWKTDTDSGALTHAGLSNLLTNETNG